MKRMIVAMLVLVAMLSAAFVPMDRAKKVAENYYKNYAPTAQKGNVITRTIAKKYEGEVTYYAFEFGNQNGFVIVTADDGLRTILGWSFDSGLCSEEDFYNMKNPFAHRMSWTDREIIQARKDKYVDVKAQKDWKDIENNIFPSASKAIVVPALVQTRWGQGYPYNTLCPMDGTSRSLVGCVATSMAQIMRYHMGTENPTGSNSYYCSNLGTTVAISNYGDYTYDYSLMPTTTAAINLATEITEVSELSYGCGVAVDMNYGYDGSGAYTSDVKAAMVNHFEYSNTATYVSVGTPTTETAQATNINTSLAASRPIIWAGDDATEGGHCFILDGRTDDYQYHFNWGWEGGSDGWFKINALTPTGYNFASGQEAIYGLYCISDEFLNWPVPTNVANTLANNEDITVTWTRPAGVKLGTLTGYKLFRNDVQIAAPASGATSYVDNDLTPGIYNYYLSATYSTPDGESHYSTNTSRTITENTTYPIATQVTSTTVGRTGIDVYWHKPFIGTVFLSDGFEAGNLSAWTLKSSKLFTQSNSWWLADDGTRWFCEDGSNLGPEYINSGLYSAAIGYSAGAGKTQPMSWLCSPAINLTNSGATLNFARWYFSNSTYPASQLYVKLYWGTFTETKGSNVLNSCENIDFYDTVEESGPYAYDSKTYTTTHTGTGTRVCFIFNYTDGFQAAVDDIVLGYGSKQFADNTNPAPYKPVANATRKAKDPNYNGERYDLPSGLIVNGEAPKGSIEPIEYQVYRNGSLAATVTRDGMDETWTDTGFTDGWNEYFVKCVYPGPNYSQPSVKVYSYIDANPVPGYLSGVLNANQADVDLDWYAPYHQPAGWFGYIGAEPDSYFDYLDKTNYPGTWKKKRTRMYGADLGLYYPITVDSIAAAFYEDAAEPWADSMFTFKVYTFNTAGTADSVLYTSGLLEAESGFFTYLKLPTPLVMVKSWFVEFEVRDNTNSSQPGVFSSIGTDGFSSTYYTPTGTELAEGWYSITDGTNPYEWWIINYCTGTEPVIAKDGSVVSQKEKVITLGPQDAIKAANREIEYPVVNKPTSSKGLTKYNVWRNGVDIADVTGATSYKDVGAPSGDNTYYITAVYASPTGESVGCDPVVVNVPASQVIPAVPSVTTSVVAGQVKLAWAACADATSYDIYSCATPYGTYALLTNVTALEYTYTGTETKMFFYVVSKNGTKASPRTIEIVRPASAK
jgi:hypothetical protein